MKDAKKESTERPPKKKDETLRPAGGCCCTRLPGKGSQERMRQSLYEKYASEDAVVENLRDAGCSSSQIECFLDWQEEERTADQLSTCIGKKNGSTVWTIWSIRSNGHAESRMIRKRKRRRRMTMSRFDRFDFDKTVDRRRSNSMKWDVAENELPMWVADMDFQTAPAVRQAIQKRAEHGVFGYTIVPDAWYEAYMGWWKMRHEFEIKKNWLIFCTGVVPAISSMVRKLTTPAEKVLIQTPVYNIFFNSILNNGRVVLESPLVYENGAYGIDFDDLEEKLSDPQTTLMILCNPHNPVGKIWDRGTLERIGDLCWKHHVRVISDEIHCDLTAPGCSYVPFASVSEKCRENSITCIAPTKAFNLAGLQTAAVVVPNPVLRHKVWRGLNTDEVAEPNAFAMDAAIAAFTEGGEWLDALREYVFENKRLVEEYVKKEIPGISVVPSQATYLSWLDCTSLSVPAEELAAFIREKTGLYLSSGEQYGGQGKWFLRMNLACPRSVAEDGLDRLKRGIQAFRSR